MISFRVNYIAQVSSATIPLSSDSDTETESEKPEGPVPSESPGQQRRSISTGSFRNGKGTIPSCLRLLML
jgi:hypothetical protein